MYTPNRVLITFTIQCLNIKEERKNENKEIKIIYHSLQGFILLWTIWISNILEQALLSAENTAVLLPKTLLAGGKDEESTENGTFATFWEKMACTN